MTDDKIKRSQVQLTTVVVAADRNKLLRHSLVTVGEAATFIQDQFTPQRSADVDWKHAASSLQHAAEKRDLNARQHATDALVALLNAEQMLVD